MCDEEWEQPSSRVFPRELVFGSFFFFFLSGKAFERRPGGVTGTLEVWVTRKASGFDFRQMQVLLENYPNHVKIRGTRWQRWFDRRVLRRCRSTDPIYGPELSDGYRYWDKDLFLRLMSRQN